VDSVTVQQSEKRHNRVVNLAAVLCSIFQKISKVNYFRVIMVFNAFEAENKHIKEFARSEEYCQNVTIESIFVKHTSRHARTALEL
jgi:hypothetical protein